MVYSLTEKDMMKQQRFTTPKELSEKLPLNNDEKEFIESSRQAIRNILNGTDPRKLLIVGPCSIHNSHEALHYAEKLKQLSDQVKDSFVLIMRAYVEKPRTSIGWQGLLNDPHLDGSHCLETGFYTSRNLLIKLAEMRVPTACEFLDPLSSLYHSDLISWGCVGARTSASQVHRLMASRLNMPVAFKNSTEGSIESAVNGCLFAKMPHSFVGPDEDGALSIFKSSGNPDVHIVLRGGEGKPNYDKESIQKALKLMSDNKLNPNIIVDCSHDNSEKNHEKQPVVFQHVMEQMREGNLQIKGIMLESYLEEGNQAFNRNREALKFGVSVTDPCLSWKDTEKLILHAQHH